MTVDNWNRSHDGDHLPGSKPLYLLQLMVSKLSALYRQEVPASPSPQAETQA